MREAILLDRIADLVRNISLQPALLYVEHLVEHAGDVEAQGVHAFERIARGNLLLGQPLLVGEGKLQLVAVEGSLLAAQDRQPLLTLHLADASQVVIDLLLLIIDLICIVQMLPLAATTHAKMRTERLRSLRGITMEANHLALSVTMLLTCQLNIHHIAGSHKRHENDHLVHPCDSLALSGNICNGYLL